MLRQTESFLYNFKIKYTVNTPVPSTRKQFHAMIWFESWTAAFADMLEPD